MRHVRSCLVAFVFASLLPAATAQQLIATVRVGTVPVGIAVNSTTNKIYVSNLEGTVTVIDGVTFATTTVVVGDSPYGAAVNPVTNQTYVSNVCGNDPTCQSDGTVTVIDGVTLATTTVVVGAQPGSVVVNPVTNKIYVLNRCGDQPNCVQYSSGTVTVIDGVTLSTATVPVGISASSIAVNPQSNKIYVTNSCGSDPTCQSDGTVTQIDGASLSTTTIPVGLDPVGIAVDSVANKIYDLDSGGFTGDVTVIDGTTLSTTTVPAGVRPSSIDVNSVTHKIYVGNLLGGNITVIDGATLSTTTVSVETEPSAVAVDSVTNKIYVHNRCGNDPTCQLEKSSVTVIDGASLSVANIGFGQAIGQALVVDPVHNRIYVPDSDFDVGIIDGTVPSPLAFIPSTPCRVVDTRNPAGEFGGPPIQGNSYRSFPIPQGSCNIPSTAAAYSLNVTVVPHGPLGYLTIWPSGEAQPYVSTMNSPDGRIKANAAIVPGGANGAVSVYVTNTTDVILDIDGYFEQPGSGTYQFYPLTPCRLVDTRGANGNLGGPRLQAQTPRSFPLLQSNCIPAGLNPLAYSLNFTVVPNPSGQPLAYLTVWPTGESQPTVSTLNNPTATVVANAAIVPAGTNGDIDVYAYNTTDLLIDINGYFAAPGQNGLSLYATVPCRALDTRQPSGNGPFSGALNPPADVINAGCSVWSTAQAYVLNATAVPVGSLGYLTLWPDGEQQPVVSTLNAYDGAITSNMAIVPAGNQGKIDAYAFGTTNLILDISGYFAP